MRHRMRAASLAVLSLLASQGCGVEGPAAASRPAGGNGGDRVAPGANAHVGDWDAELLAVAAAYRTWTRVSDRANWSPLLCSVPPPAGIQVSESRDPDTHGRKLYYLFAKDAQAYDDISWKPLYASWNSSAEMPAEERARLVTSPVGQTIVKEAWHPLPGDGKPGGPLPETPGSVFEYPNRDKAELFVMTKLDPATPGTDQGWVYGVLSPDGTRVVAAGRIESCMECHVKTDRDRLFGFKAAR